MTQPVQHIAHFNIARLRAMPGDQSVAEFIDNAPKVNAVAERSPGFIWRLQDDTARVAEDVTFEAVLGDPLLAVSLSVWETVDALRYFVKQTVHGTFVRRRESWFEPAKGPVYVIWPVPIGTVPTLTEGKARLAHLAQHGPSDYAFDFAFQPQPAE
jgi:heme-degrading monooxygenase HmoA